MVTLQEKGIDVDQDPTTGGLVLTMGKTFYFDNNSADLSSSAKQVLNVTIPELIRHIFDETILDHEVEAITITGHASPTFGIDYVDPNRTDTAAYQYNLELSEKRAKAIKSYILSDDIGFIPHKTNLDRLIQVFGKSYSQPVLLGEGELRTRCGNYSCPRSRRVEINLITGRESRIAH